MKTTVLYLQQIFKSVLGVILGGLLYIGFYYTNGFFVKAVILLGLYLFTRIIMYKPKTTTQSTINNTKSTTDNVIKLVK